MATSFVAGGKVHAVDFGQIVQLTNPNTQSIGNAADTFLNLNGVTKNTTAQPSSAWWSGGTPNQINIPNGYGGTYRITARCIYTASAGGTRRRMNLQQNGGPSVNNANYMSGLSIKPDGSWVETNIIQLVDTLDFAASDQIFFTTYQDSGGALSTITAWNMPCLKITFELLTYI